MEGTIAQSEQEILKREITNSLKIITEVFQSCNANYRIIGSTLVVAHLNKVFRRIHDVDIILDIKSKDCVFGKLKNHNFIFEERSAAGFSWIEVKKDGCLGLAFFLTGKFKEYYFTWNLTSYIELRIKNNYLTPTNYTFGNTAFTGIPISSAIAGIRQSFLNPKRTLDKKMLHSEIATTKVKTYNNISIYFFGVRIPYLYDMFSFFYNIYGGIRVMFGKKYEFWEK